MNDNDADYLKALEEHITAFRVYKVAKERLENAEIRLFLIREHQLENAGLEETRQ